ncbi:sensor histidine kinase [Nonomuraea sp. SBT364]|uniref:sensor histidine kinase n=1 Tax=Nonomuraea sp. SBT364 TaxID=1580530 RepID=UPI00069EA293|nr:sensor histidine kinase [Nonomuraea sp. SBT364]
MFSAVLEPFRLALYRGDADPPAPRRFTLRVPRWLGLLPFDRVDLARAGDLVLAFLIFIATASDPQPWRGSGSLGQFLPYVAAVAFSLPLVLRDRRPLIAWRIAAGLIPLVTWATDRGSGDPLPYTMPAILCYLLVIYAVAVRCDRRITMAVLALSVLAVWILHRNSTPIAVTMLAVAVLFGYNVRVRRSATDRLVQEERRTQEAVSAQAVLEERARIARELHDVVAHHMSVIAIQAEAVPLRAAGDPAQLEAGLAEIRGLSLDAIAQLRQVLGVLRDQDGRTGTAPQPGLDRIDDLIANARATGLSVLVRRPDSLDGLPPAVGLSAYRIVQESLSNAMRHAPGATVMLDLGRDERAVRLHVTNGPGSAPPGEPGAGQGLVGMRERAALLGGTLDAGPVPVGGFQVTAILPVDEQGSA